jgi:hypothetical protein
MCTDLPHTFVSTACYYMLQHAILTTTLASFLCKKKIGSMPSANKRVFLANKKARVNVSRAGSGNFLGILGRLGPIALRTDAAVLRRKPTSPPRRVEIIHEVSSWSHRRVKKYGTQK